MNGLLNTIIESDYNEVINEIPDILYEIDVHGNFIFISKSISRWGYEPAQLIGKHFSHIICEDDLPTISRDVLIPALKGIKAGSKSAPKLIDERRTGNRITKNLKVRLKSGPNIKKLNRVSIFEIFSTGLYEYDKKRHKVLIGTLGIMRDTNQNIKNEAIFLKTENFVNLLIENSNEIITILAHDGTILFKNNSIKHILGYEPIELIGSNEYDFIPIEDKTILSEILENHSILNTLPSFEYRFCHKSNKWRTLRSTITSVKDGNGNNMCFILNSHDISDQKMLEEELKQSLCEKEILIKELHHRVKNNLQIVMSILSLQSYKVDESKYYSYVEESKLRIYAMALVHEKLYKSENMAKVDFSQYLNELINTLFNSYNLNRQQMRFHIDVKDLCLGIDEAVPCAMIFNELILNSIKHAFPHGQPGEIIVSFNKTIIGKNMLIVKDDGIGLPKDFDVQISKTLGMEIVRALTKQINGVLEIDGSTGTVVKIIF